MFNRLLNLAKGDDRSSSEVDVATVAALPPGAVQIVDVREPDEWADGHISDAVHIPLGNLILRADELDPTRPTITVCHVGQRSLHAVGMLESIGFPDVKSLAGGMAAWERAGQPIIR